MRGRPPAAVFSGAARAARAVGGGLSNSRATGGDGTSEHAEALLVALGSKGKPGSTAKPKPKATNAKRRERRQAVLRLTSNPAPKAVERLLLGWSPAKRQVARDRIAKPRKGARAAQMTPKREGSRRRVAAAPRIRGWLHTAAPHPRAPQVLVLSNKKTW